MPESIQSKMTTIWGGISQQPPHQRYPNQVQDAENWVFSVVDGARKRAGTDWVATITGLQADGDYRFHPIIRDDDEKYLVIHGEGMLRVFSEAGAEATVNISATAAAYLAINSPSANQIHMVSVADYTLILNTLVVSGTKTAGAELDETTLPVQMVRTSIATLDAPAVFDVDVIAWVARSAGDNTTNPAPSLMTDGRKIADIAFHRNRLVLAGDENVVFSQAGDFFNFYIADPTNIVESDPIDIALSSETVTLIDYVVPFRKSLLIFTKAGRQFELNAPEVLTPSTAAITPSTAYKSLPYRPQTMGNMIYFPGERGDYAAIYEYYYDDSQVTNTAADITAHVPRLLGSQVRSITTSSNNNSMFVLTPTEPPTENLLTESGDNLILENDSSIYTKTTNFLLDIRPYYGNTIFAYKQFWSGTKKEQSAWCKFAFGADYDISDMAIVNNKCYLLVHVSGSWTIESFDVADITVDDTIPFTVHLDRKVVATATGLGGAFPGQFTTTWTLPYQDTMIDHVIVGEGIFTGKVLTPSSVIISGDQTIVTVSNLQIWERGNVYIGRSFNSTLTLSRQHRRDHNGQANIEGVVHYRRITAAHQNSGDYTIKAETLRRATRTKTFDPGEFVIESAGKSTAYINGNADDTTLKIESNSHKPVTITGVEIEEDYVSRRNR